MFVVAASVKDRSTNFRLFENHDVHSANQRLELSGRKRSCEVARVRMRPDGLKKGEEGPCRGEIRDERGEDADLGGLRISTCPNAAASVAAEWRPAQCSLEGKEASK